MKILTAFLVAILFLLALTVSSVSGKIDESSKSNTGMEDRVSSAVEQTTGLVDEQTPDNQPFYMQPAFIGSVFAVLIVALIVVFTLSYREQEQKIARRTEELERARKEVETRNTELERFTCTVSHDLRTPLTAIRGFAELLKEHLKRNIIEKAEHDLKQIEKATIKMAQLLNDTLQLSRIGHAANPPKDVPFGEIVREALEQTSGQIKSSGIEVSVAEGFPTVRVDQLRMVEVLTNLIENSVNYMGEQPHPKIELGYRVDGKETVFFVKDNGVGIEKSQHEKVFGLFYRVDGSCNEGTGAGLAIVKRIIDVHGGHIWIESEKGKGCTVCFTVPV